MAVSVAAHSVPKKLFYRIQEVAQITGVKPHVLRYWETEFRQLSPRKDMNDQRRYTRADIDLVLRIKKLLYEERFTIAGAKRQLRQEASNGRDEIEDEAARGVNLQSLRALRRDISELLSLLDKPQRSAA
jgi:DNA-binding transcriptional MerR regulator